jgi:hypothetical protein
LAGPFVAIVHVMTSTRTPRLESKQATLDRLIELLAQIEVERYLAEIENDNAVRKDAGCKSGDLRPLQR